MRGSQIEEGVKGSMATAPREKSLILIGRTGNGKSATGNSILGRSAFKSEFSYSTLTKECEMQQTTLKDGRVLNVVDTPGLFDPSAPQDSVQKEIIKCIEFGKDGIHAVLLVLSVKNRFSPEEASVLDGLQSLFGPEIVNYVIVVFTGGDVLESDDVTIDDYFNDCPQTLKELLHRCNMRMVVFNNKTKSERKKEEQLAELLKQIEKISAKNGGRPYFNEMFQQAQAMAKEVLVESERLELQREEESSEANSHLLQLSVDEMIEEKLLKATKELEEQFASERSARRQAEEQRTVLEHKKHQLELKKKNGFFIEHVKKIVENITKKFGQPFKKCNEHSAR